MLAEDVVWHVPGTSAIAGDHHGRAAVMDHFALRRELAGGRMEIVPRGELHGGDVVVHLADGRATLGGEPARWRTAGVYRVADGRIAEAWLVPLELDAFDAAWRRAG
jgi:ketosteroid isomerase-like protein